jgi:hypothetical protein
MPAEMPAPYSGPYAGIVEDEAGAFLLPMMIFEDIANTE